MNDTDEFEPVDPHHLTSSVALALTKGNRRQRDQGADVMASVIAERVVAELLAHYRILQRAPPKGTYCLAGPPLAKTKPVEK